MSEQELQQNPKEGSQQPPAAEADISSSAAQSEPSETPETVVSSEEFEAVASEPAEEIQLIVEIAAVATFESEPEAAIVLAVEQESAQTPEAEPTHEPTAEATPEAANEAAAEAEPTHESTAEATPEAASEAAAEAEPTAESATEAAAGSQSDTEIAADHTPATEEVAAAEAVFPTAAEAEPSAEDAEQAAAKAAAAAEKAAAKAAEKAAEAERRRQHKEMLDGLFAELESIHADKGVVEVTITERVKGGLRVQYKDLRLFLPASHFSLRKAASEQDMQNSVGQTVQVHINEIQQDEQGRKTVVVSRRKILLSDRFNAFNEGDIVEGKVVSTAPFGVFVDLNGVEGLIHISRLSNVRVDDASQIVKKGDTIKAKIISVDKSSGRISLSSRELEESPWLRAEAELPAGSRVKGIVKRMSEFGTYIAVRPGIEGLLRNSDLSWGRRVHHASEMLAPGQEIEVVVLNINPENRRLALGLKQIQPNPWETIVETLPIGSDTTAVVRQSSQNGLVVRLNDAFDGFIPRSKVRNIGGKAKNYAPGDTIEVTVLDIAPETFSLILTPKYDEAALAADTTAREERAARRDDRPRRNDRETQPQPAQQDAAPTFTFFDLLSEKEQEGLRGSNG